MKRVVKCVKAVYKREKMNIIKNTPIYNEIKEKTSD